MSLPRLHRAVVLVVVAVVVALALVLTVLAGTRDRPDGERREPAAAPAGASPAVPTEPVAGTGLRRLRLEELPAGPPPRIGYAVGRREYVAPDGSRHPLRAPYGVSGFVPWGDGFLVADTRWFEGTVGLAWRDGTGRVLREWPSGGPPVGTADGRVAWTRVTVSEAEDPGPARVFLGSPDGTIRAQTVRPGIIHPLGFAGDRVVFARAWRAGVFVTDLERRPVRLAWSPRRPGPVSPDGARIVSYAGTGIRVHRLGDGTVLRRLDLPRGWATSVAWEDDRHLLAVVQQGRRAAVVRLPLAGGAERVTPVRRARGAQAAYVLATRR